MRRALSHGSVYNNNKSIGLDLTVLSLRRSESVAGIAFFCREAAISAYFWKDFFYRNYDIIQGVGATRRGVHAAIQVP